MFSSLRIRPKTRPEILVKIFFEVVCQLTLENEALRLSRELGLLGAEFFELEHRGIRCHVDRELLCVALSDRQLDCGASVCHFD